MCVTVWRESAWRRPLPSSRLLFPRKADSRPSTEALFLFDLSQRPFFLPQVLFALFARAFSRSREETVALLGDETGGLGGGGRSPTDRPTERLLCLGAPRRSAAQPGRRTRLSGSVLVIRGKPRKFHRMTSIQYKCSIHCCFCIQPLDSVKCFNICAILNYFKRIVYTGQKCTALFRQ